MNKRWMVGVVVSVLSACGPLSEQLVAPLTVAVESVHPRQLCSQGVVRATTGAGDQALCTVPKIACDPAEDIQSATYCHFAPSESPTSTCCEPRPANCAATDCECLLRDGPWIDYLMAADAGTTLAAYNGPKWKCSYRVSCTAAADGGVALIACTPA